MNDLPPRLSQSRASLPAAAEAVLELHRQDWYSYTPKIAKLCYLDKQHFAWPAFDTRSMEFRSINTVFATNLGRLMTAKGWSQLVLAEKSGVAQRSISNYLSPNRRDRGASGKEPSAKLTEMGMIASALGVDAWEMLVEREAHSQARPSKLQAELVALFQELPDQAKVTLLENARLLHQATKTVTPDTATGNRKIRGIAGIGPVETKAAA